MVKSSKTLVNVFGAGGFIGSNYVNKNKSIVNDRNDLVPKLEDCNQVLYLISTVDNYNVLTNPYVDIETNLTTLVRVLENFRKANKKGAVFNFVSSWFVYGDAELPAKETSPCNPKGFYSITKRAAEQLLISYCETYKLNYRILRLANVYGGEDKKFSKKKNAFTYLLNELKNNNDINLYDGGKFFRDFIHVEDVVNAMQLVIEKGELNEIYNISSGKKYSFLKLMQHAKKSFNSSSKFITIDQPEFHKIVQVKNMWLENVKLNNLGFVEKHCIYNYIESLKDEHQSFS